MIYPEHLKTPKARSVYWFYKQLYIFERGKGDVIGRFTGYFQESATLAILLKVFGVTWSISIWIIFFIGMVVICYILGFYYIRYGVDKINNYVCQERNEIAHEVYKKICGEDKK
jgi:hypothetical protein